MGEKTGIYFYWRKLVYNFSSLNYNKTFNKFQNTGKIASKKKKKIQEKSPPLRHTNSEFVLEYNVNLEVLTSIYHIIGP